LVLVAQGVVEPSEGVEQAAFEAVTLGQIALEQCREVVEVVAPVDAVQQQPDGEAFDPPEMRRLRDHLPHQLGADHPTDPGPGHFRLGDPAPGAAMV
jgi:hypothetical protein